MSLEDLGFSMKDMLDNVVDKVETFQDYTYKLDTKISNDINRLETDIRQNAKTTREEMALIYSKLDMIIASQKSVEVQITSLKGDFETSQANAKADQLVRDGKQNLQILGIKKDLKISSMGTGGVTGIIAGFFPQILDFLGKLIK